MFHTKFRGNRPAGSGEEDFLRVMGTFKKMAPKCDIEGQKSN